MGNMYDEIKLEDIYNLASKEISLSREKLKHHRQFTTPRIPSSCGIYEIDVKNILPMREIHLNYDSKSDGSASEESSRCSTACSSVQPKSVTWEDRSIATSRGARPRGGIKINGFIESPRSLPETPRSTDCRRILKSHDNMTLIRNRSAPSMGAQCIRSESRVNPDLKESVNPISRQVCDVLGPFVCHICGKIKTRSHSVERCASQFPSIHISEDHFKKALLLSKHMPGLTTKQLQEKVAHGEVSLGQLKSSSSRNKPKQTKKKPVKQLRSVGPDGTSWMYFSDIKDLDHRISSGVMDKMAKAMPEMFGEYVQKRKDRARKSIENQLTPQFLSENATEMKSKYPIYYEPPVLSIDVIRDRAKHDFFADQKGSYKLPDRLPENIVPPEVTHALEELYEQVRRDSSAISDKGAEDLLKRLKILGPRNSKRQY